MREIPLYDNRSNIIGYATVDDADYENLAQWKWRNAYGYAIRATRKDGVFKEFRMHRVIMKCPEGLVVDHISGDKLDNRKENLRICTPKENSRNSMKQGNTKSIYKGVSITKDGKYSSSIRYGDNQYWLGQFSTELEAAKVYNINARKYHEDFAGINVIDEDNIIVNYRKYGSIYKGVYKLGSRWTSRVWHNKHNISLGNYNNEEDAARAYNVAIYNLRGKDAILNSVDNWESFRLLKKESRNKECIIDVPYVS